MQTISHYDIGKEIGRGAFGTVFAATRKYDRKKVAVKRIEKALLRGGKQLLSRVKQEIRIHSNVSHDNIIKLLAVFDDPEYIYIILDLGATDLYRYIQTNGPLAERQLRLVLKELVSGLDYLHRCKIIHRDLKLSNLLLSNEGQVVCYLIPYR
jgi:serine/threonine protein kinase